MKSSRSLFIHISVLLATIFPALLVHGEPTQPDPASILKEASAALLAHPSFRLDASILYLGKLQGTREEIPTQFTIAVKRPDGVSVHILNSQNDVYVYGDGKNFTRYVPAFKQYIVEPQTMSSLEIVAASGFELIEPALRALAEIASPAPFTGALAPQLPKFVGNEDVNGHTCDRVHFSTPERGYDVWIETAPTKLIRRIQPEMSPEEAKFAQQYNTTVDFTVVASLQSWDFNAELSSLLTYAPSEGVEKVAMFMPPRPKYPAEDLPGTVAPDFTLPLLSGGDVNLAKQKGNVVVLDFWATWCQPCREGLPVMQQIADEYAGKGVKVFAVNQADEEAAVKAYLADAKLEKLPVLMDADHKVTELYKATVIPQTVIIASDGKIHSVHIGIQHDPAVLSKATNNEEALKLIRESHASKLRAELDELLRAKAPVEK